MPFSNWVIGEDGNSDEDVVVHTSSPWLRASFSEDDIELEPGKLRIETDGYVFFDFRFPEGALPAHDALEDLCKTAALVIDHLRDEDDEHLQKLTEKN